MNPATLTIARMRPIFVRFQKRWHVVGRELEREMAVIRNHGGPERVQLGEAKPYGSGLESAPVLCFHRYRFINGLKTCIRCKKV